MTFTSFNLRVKQEKMAEIVAYFNSACRDNNLTYIKSFRGSVDEEFFNGVVKNCIGFGDACVFGRIDVLTYLLTSDEFKKTYNTTQNISLGLTIALELQHFDLVKFFIYSKDINKRGLITKNVKRVFKAMCMKGDFNFIKYMMTSPEIKKHISLDYDNIENMAAIACASGNLELVDFLFTSPEIKVHADLGVGDHTEIIKACSNGHLEVVKYLLSSPKLSTHSDIHFMDDISFFYAFKNGHMNVIDYLIFDYKIEVTERIKDMFFANSELEVMFNKRDLDISLNRNGNKSVKIKI